MWKKNCSSDFSRKKTRNCVLSQVILRDKPNGFGSTLAAGVLPVVLHTGRTCETGTTLALQPVEL